MMTWNNQKIKQLNDLNNQEARELYDEYKESIKEANNSKTTREVDDTSDLYSKKDLEKLTAYKVIVGDETIPVTPKDLSFDNKTEEKKYKNVFGQELILGIIVLPKQVKFKGTFPYYKVNGSDKEPMEYVEYFEQVKNSGEEIEFKVEGSDISFNAYITEFNYKLIPGRDIDFNMALKEVLEVQENEIDI